MAFATKRERGSKARRGRDGATGGARHQQPRPSIVKRASRGPMLKYLKVLAGLAGALVAGVAIQALAAKPEQVLEHGFDDERKMKFIKIFFNEDLAE